MKKQFSEVIGGFVCYFDTEEEMNAAIAERKNASKPFAVAFDMLRTAEDSILQSTKEGF